MTTNCWWKDTFLWSLAEDKKMCAQCSHMKSPRCIQVMCVCFVVWVNWRFYVICVRFDTSASLRAPVGLHKASVSYHDVSPAERPVLICPVFYQSACIAVPWGDRPTCSLFVCAGRIPVVTCVTSRNKDDIVNGGEFWPLSCKRGETLFFTCLEISGSLDKMWLLTSIWVQLSVFPLGIQLKIHVSSHTGRDL